MSDADDSELRPLRSGGGMDQTMGDDDAPQTDAGTDPAAGGARGDAPQSGTGSDGGPSTSLQGLAVLRSLNASDSDVMQAPFTAHERRIGVPLYLAALAFAVCAMLALSSTGLHSYSLFQAISDHRTGSGIAALQEARDELSVARYAAGVLLGSAQIEAAVALAVDAPEQFADFEHPHDTNGGDFTTSGGRVLLKTTVLQRRFKELFEGRARFFDAVDDATAQIRGSAKDAALRLREAGDAAFTTALTLSRQYHAGNAATVATAIARSTALATLDAVIRSVEADVVPQTAGRNEFDWFGRLNVLRCVQSRAADLATAAGGLGLVSEQRDARGVVAAVQPAQVELAVGRDASLRYMPWVGAAAEAPASSSCAAIEKDDGARAAIEALDRAVTAFGDVARPLSVRAGVIPRPIELTPISDFDANAVDAVFHAQLLAVVDARRTASWESVTMLRNLVVSNAVSLGFCLVSALAAIAGAVLTWRYAADVVSTEVRYQRLVDRHEAVNDTSALAGLRAEVVALSVPGWDEYVTAEAEADPTSAVANAANKSSAARRRERKQSLVHGEAEALARSMRPRVVERVATTREAPSTAADTSAAKQASSPASNGAGSGGSTAVSPGTAAGGALRSAIKEFAVAVSCTIARLRAFVPQPCFGDVEADAANAIAGKASGGGGGSGGAGGGSGAGGNSGGSAGGGASMPLQSTQLLSDVRTRELRHDKNEHLVFGTLLLIDANGAIGAADGQTLSEDVTGAESVTRGAAAIRPAFAAVSRFVEIVEDIANRHDGLLLGASGDDFGIVWNLVGQSAIHQTRAVAAALVLQRTFTAHAEKARDDADECHSRMERLAAQAASARNAAARRTAEEQVEAAKAELAVLESTARWFGSRARGIAVASGPMCAGNVVAQLHSHVHGGASLSGTKAGGNAAANSEAANPGVVDRSGNTLDRGAETAAMRRNARAQMRNASKVVAKTGASVLAAASPRWFEVIGPALGLCHHMLRLNQRLGTKLLCTEDVANAALQQSAAGAVLDEVIMRELRALVSISNDDLGSPGVVTRAVGVYFQPAVGADQEAAANANAGTSERTSMQMGGASSGKRDSSRGMSTAATHRGMQGQWTTICSVGLGFPHDERGPPLGWAEVFDHVSNNVRRGNLAAAQDALKDYLFKGREGDVAAGGESGGAATATPSRRRRKSTSKGPSDRDPIIVAWLQDLEQKVSTKSADAKDLRAAQAVGGLR